jgi:hypothetical protein
MQTEREGARAHAPSERASERETSSWRLLVGRFYFILGLFYVIVGLFYSTVRLLAPTGRALLLYGRRSDLDYY